MYVTAATFTDALNTTSTMAVCNPTSTLTTTSIVTAATITTTRK